MTTQQHDAPTPGSSSLQERDEYLEAVARRVETYESCAAAIAAATASLQELSAGLEQMTRAAQQLNAFTGGWLAVWKRARRLESVRGRMATRADAERRRQPWNPSTRLRGAPAATLRNGEEDEDRVEGGDEDGDARLRREWERRPTSGSRARRAARSRAGEEKRSGHLAADESACVRSTRAMIERAVSLAFSDAAPLLDQAAFEDPRESVASEWDSPARGGREEDSGRQEDKENTQAQQQTSAGVLKEAAGLETAVDASECLHRQQRERREKRAQQTRDAVARTKREHEFLKQLAAVAFEYQQRKLAVQALQARIEREMQYLQSTAADLSKRDALLDDAFRSYEQMLRVEFGCHDHQQQQQQQDAEEPR